MKPIFIAHRGNTHGAQPTFENQISYLLDARAQGYAVECDIQVYQDNLYLGHDEPQQSFPVELMGDNKVICHAKTPEAFQILLDMRQHCFYHENDQVTLTSQGYIWCFPGVHPRLNRSIWLDLHDQPLPKTASGIYGICGDRRSIMDELFER